MKTTIINLLGGPGIGKSTLAAHIYALLKSWGVSCELVREYVKEHAWEGRQLGPYDQFHVTGEQIRREALLLGKTNVIVTDSPVLVGVEYARRYSPKHVAKGVLEAAKAYYRQAQEDGHEHINVLLTRTKPYKPEGRYQSEAEARKIDKGMLELLHALGLPKITAHESEAADLAEAVRALNNTLNGGVIAAVSPDADEFRANWGFAKLFTETPPEVGGCFICSRPPDGEVAGVKIFECGHPQVMEKN